MNAADLHKIMPLAGPLCEVFAQHLNAACMEFNISTRMRQASFLPQIAHESGQLRNLVENLNYKPDALLTTFNTSKIIRFTRALAEQYGRTAARPANQEMIANIAYANRMGNGSIESGDGWRFRGAGLIQLTGKENQADCAKYFRIDLDTIGSWLRTPEGASRSAAWFWRTHGCNELADKGMTELITKTINGGDNGLAERIALYQTALQVLV